MTSGDNERSFADNQSEPDMEYGGSARLVDVAREAGVAIATVSRALNNPLRVNAKTRMHVLEVAKRLGYTANAMASSLRSGQSHIVLVIMPPWRSFNMLDPVLYGIDSELMRAGYSMIVGNLGDERQDDTRLMKLAGGGLVDGILAITQEAKAGGDVTELAGRLPMVGVLVDLSGLGVPSFVTDERGGTRELTSLLIARGCRRLMYISGPVGHYHDNQRQAGFDDVVRQTSSPLSTVHIEGNYTYEAGVRAAEALLAMSKRPDGVVATSDAMAIAFIDRLRQAGVRVPEDVAVCGFDDISGAAYCTPSLTTYRQPLTEMGASSARLLLSMMGDDSRPGGVCHVVPGHVVRRESA
ncbi:MAG: LacI family DNA-binding transcriptional regulator [Bradyrhizobium sp.]|nr:LacI family DNA-binding transcriptional regulator [Bradyrhizobium sp.]